MPKFQTIFSGQSLLLSTTILNDNPMAIASYALTTLPPVYV